MTAGQLTTGAVLVRLYQVVRRLSQRRRGRRLPLTLLGYLVSGLACVLGRGVARGCNSF